MDIKRLKMVKVRDLKLDPRNVNRHDEQSIAALITSLKTFGQFRTIEIDSENVVQKGNGLTIAAMRIGWESLLCYVTPLTGPKLDASNIADNQTAKLSDFDHDALSKMVLEIQVNNDRMMAEMQCGDAMNAIETDALLKSMGFDSDGLQRLLAATNVVPPPAKTDDGKDGDKKTDGNVKFSVVVPCSSKESQDSVYNAIVSAGFKEARKVET